MDAAPRGAASSRDKRSSWAKKAKTELRAIRQVIILYPSTILWPILVLGLVLGVGVWGVTYVARAEQNSSRDRAATVALDAALWVQQFLTNAIAPVMLSAAMVTYNPQYDAVRPLFLGLAPEMLAWTTNGTLRELQLVPNGVVSAVYPHGTGTAEGTLDLFAIAGQRDVVIKTVKDRAITLAGPLKFVQGGYGVIVRQPIFVPADSENETWGSPYLLNPLCGQPCAFNTTTRTKLWGFVSGLVELSGLQHSGTSRLRSLEDMGYLYELQAPSNNMVAASYKRPEDPVEEVVHLPNIEWVIRVAPDHGWSSKWYGGLVAGVVVLAVATSLLLFLALLAWRRHQMLLEALLPKQLLADLRAEDAASLGRGKGCQGGFAKAGDTPADLLLDMMSELLAGGVPRLSDVVFIRTALLRNLDLYTPLNVGEHIREANLDAEVAQALMQQLVGERQDSNPGLHWGEGSSLHAGGAGGAAALGLPAGGSVTSATALALASVLGGSDLDSSKHHDLGTLMGALAFVVSPDAFCVTPNGRSINEKLPPGVLNSLNGIAFIGGEPNNCNGFGSGSAYGSGGGAATAAGGCSNDNHNVSCFAANHRLAEPPVTAAGAAVSALGKSGSRADSGVTSSNAIVQRRSVKLPLPLLTLSPVVDRPTPDMGLLESSAGAAAAGAAGGGPAVVAGETGGTATSPSASRSPLAAAATPTSMTTSCRRASNAESVHSVMVVVGDEEGGPSGERPASPSSPGQPCSPNGGGGANRLAAVVRKLRGGVTGSVTPGPSPAAGYPYAAVSSNGNASATSPTGAGGSGGLASATVAAPTAAAGFTLSAASAFGAIGGRISCAGGGPAGSSAAGPTSATPATPGELSISCSGVIQGTSPLGVGGATRAVAGAVSCSGRATGNRMALALNAFRSPPRQPGGSLYGGGGVGSVHGAGGGSVHGESVCGGGSVHGAGAGGGGGQSHGLHGTMSVGVLATGGPPGEGCGSPGGLFVFGRASAVSTAAAAAVGSSRSGTRVLAEHVSRSVAGTDQDMSVVLPPPPPPPPPKILLDEAERLLCGSDSWHFDMFALQEATGGHALSVMGFYLLHRQGLISRFRLKPVVAARLLRQIEAGYRDNPYHNATHAADVLQCLHVLLHASLLNVHYIDPLGMLAAYFAAIIHDLGHPGFTGDYLTATADPLALRYNDRSPLENHHCAAAFTLMARRPELDLLAPLAALERAAFRKQVIEMVLATDMKQHFSILSHFNTVHRLAAYSQQQQQQQHQQHQHSHSHGNGHAASHSHTGQPGQGQQSLPAQSQPQSAASQHLEKAQALQSHGSLPRVFSLSRTAPSGNSAVSERLATPPSVPELRGVVIATPPTATTGACVLPGPDPTASTAIPSAVAAATAAAAAAAAEGGISDAAAAAAAALTAPRPLDETERMLGLQMALKCADIGNLGRELECYKRWVTGLEEEFFRQGDCERDRGLPISPLSDRAKQGVSKSQTGFFDFVALPLVHAMAGAFPGAQPLMQNFLANYNHWQRQSADAPPSTQQPAAAAQTLTQAAPPPPQLPSQRAPAQPSAAPAPGAPPRPSADGQRVSTSGSTPPPAPPAHQAALPAPATVGAPHSQAPSAGPPPPARQPSSAGGQRGAGPGSRSSSLRKEAGLGAGQGQQ